MKRIKKIAIVILSIIILSSTFINSYAESIVITKENLNTALQNFTSISEDKGTYKIKMTEEAIKITVNEKDYNLEYDLSGNPTFKLEIPIEKGMKYADFKEKTDNIILPAIPYIAVANIQGVEIKDATTYFFISYIKNALSSSVPEENPYIIVDDINIEEGTTIDKEGSNEKTIYASEFGERVMEYVNATYKEKQTIVDTVDGINSYEWTIERKDVTDTSCKLVSTISVNPNADFSKIKGFSDNIEGNKPDSDDKQNQEKPSDNKEETPSDDTIAKTKLPKAGIKSIIYIGIFTSLILAGIFVIKIRNYKDIK